MRLALASLALVLVTACSGPAATPSAPSITSSTAPATTTSAPALTDLADKWTQQFDAITKAFSGPVCAPANVQTKDCAQYLTAIVRTSSDLEATIRGRSDAAAYAGTLVETAKISKASEAYARARCYEGGGSFESCQAEMITITMGSVLVTSKLKLDELRKK